MVFVVTRFNFSHFSDLLYILVKMDTLKGTESIFMIILSLISQIIDIPNYSELVGWEYSFRLLIFFIISISVCLIYKYKFDCYLFRSILMTRSIWIHIRLDFLTCINIIFSCRSPDKKKSSASDEQGSPDNSSLVRRNVFFDITSAAKTLFQNGNETNTGLWLTILTLKKFWKKINTILSELVNLSCHQFLVNYEDMI